MPVGHVREAKMVPWRLVAFLACLAQAEEVLEECRHVELLQHAQQLQRSRAEPGSLDGTADRPTGGMSC
eukprot:g26367.t1